LGVSLERFSQHLKRSNDSIVGKNENKILKFLKNSKMRVGMNLNL
jgi:hypothetical protein